MIVLLKGVSIPCKLDNESIIRAARVNPEFRIRYVIERDGTVVDFDPGKIASGIRETMANVGSFDETLSVRLADEVLQILKEGWVHPDMPTVENIQDVTEKVLIENGYAKMAKVFILRRYEKERERRGRPDQDHERRPLQDFTSLTVIDGKVRVVFLAPDGKFRLADKIGSLHSILYTWASETKALMEAIAELEEILNTPNVREQDLHEFFERNEEFILNDEYKRAHSKVVLESETGERLIPDFVLEPIDQSGLCDILELKGPSARVFALKKSRMRYSAAVMEVCAQLREYSAFFDQEFHRRAIEEKYGLRAYRPSMFVIIGRRGKVDPFAARRVRDDLPKLTIKTYDEVILRMKARIERMKRGGYRARPKLEDLA